MNKIKIGSIVNISLNTDDEDLNEFISEYGNKVIIEHIEDDYFWGRTIDNINIPYHMEFRDVISDI